MPEERRHIAILFSDIVGCTPLTGEDEDRALETLKKNQEIHQRLTERLFWEYTHPYSNNFCCDIYNYELGLNH